MKIKILFFLFLGAITSCQNTGKQGQNPSASTVDSNFEINKLDGNWELFKVNDTLFTIDKVYSLNYGGQPRITIDTDNNKIGGFTGCNNWGTTLSISKDSFALNDPIEKHEQGCGGTWESEFLNFLKNNKSFALHGDNLIWTSRDNNTMTFKRKV